MAEKRTDDTDDDGKTEQVRLCEEAAQPCAICGKTTLNEEGVCYREACWHSAGLADDVGDGPDVAEKRGRRERLAESMRRCRPDGYSDFCWGALRAAVKDARTLAEAREWVADLDAVRRSLEDEVAP